MISGIILAAGASRRMGAPKQTLEVGGRAMLERVVDTFLGSSLQEVILVLTPALGWKPRKRKRLRFVFNTRSSDGISTSLRAGLEALSPKSDAVVVGLGDKPLLRQSTIEKLIEVHRRSSAEILVPVYRSKRGNPILFPRNLYEEMRRLQGDVGAKVLVEAEKHLVKEVPVNDFGVVMDVDTPKDLRSVRRLVSAKVPLAERKSGK